MTGQNQIADARQRWIDPEISELDVRETAAVPGPGADAAGNPSPDCQAS